MYIRILSAAIMDLNIFEMYLWNIQGTFVSPNGIFKYSYCSSGVMKEVYLIEDSCILIW